MDITLDIGAMALGIVTVIVIPGFAWVMNRNRKKDIADLREQEQIYQKNLRKYEELKEAVDVHASLTDPQVLQVLERAERDEAAKRSVLALHTRSTYRFEALGRIADLPHKFKEEITQTLDAISDRWEEETKESQESFNRKIGRVDDEEIQRRMRDFVAHLVGSSAESVNPGGEPQATAERLQDVASSVRLTKGRHGAFLRLPGGEHEIYFAGRKKMVDEHGEGGANQWKENLPAQIRHRYEGQNSNSCDLVSVKPGSLISQLQGQNETGEELAEAFVAALRALAGPDGKGKCGCGVPFLPGRD